MTVNDKPTLHSDGTKGRKLRVICLALSGMQKLSEGGFGPRRLRPLLAFEDVSVGNGALTRRLESKDVNIVSHAMLSVGCYIGFRLQFHGWSKRLQGRGHHHVGH
jgi:hypothetical protein